MATNAKAHHSETAVALAISVAQQPRIVAAAARSPLEIVQLLIYLPMALAEEPRATSVKVRDSVTVAASTLDISLGVIKTEANVCSHHRSGYCGSTTAHCMASSGCQASFGTCTTSDLSPDGTCGGSNGYKCKGSGFGKAIMKKHL
jgi:hypothetical protein